MLGWKSLAFFEEVDFVVHGLGTLRIEALGESFLPGL